MNGQYRPSPESALSHEGVDFDWYKTAPAAPLGAASCWNCGGKFVPEGDPNETFCSDSCADTYRIGLGL
jgi:hypothetical protein